MCGPPENFPKMKYTIAKVVILKRIFLLALAFTRGASALRVSIIF
jgi:hypothetical protein